MATGQWPKATHGYHSRSDLDELRGEVLREAIWAILALAFIVTCYAVYGSDHLRLEVLAILLLLGVSTWAAYRIRALGTTPAAITLLVGVFLTITVVLYLFPASLAPAWLALAVTLGVALLGPRPGFFLALFASLLLIVLTRNAGVSVGDLPGALLLVWTSTILAWLASRPLYTALDWAWMSYAQAVETTNQLRDRQRELARTLKSLNDAYYRLELANQELARAREAAQEARRLKTEFAANISHELRTPLNLIIGFSEILMSAPKGREGAVLPAEFRADVDMIHRNAQHLSALIDDVLDLSQVDAGRMGLSRERTSIITVVEESLEVVSRLFELRGLSLVFDASPDIPPVYIDRTRIRQVLINLLNNAARFTEHGGASVRVHCEDSEIVVAVADTGIGMAPEDIPKAFEEFRQIDGSTRRAHGGSGLGLAISKRFIELHGGTMWAESLPGKGSTFYFTLPLKENVASAPIRHEWETWVRLQPSTDTPEKSVVVVSADAGLANLFRRYLDGYRTLPVATDDAARQLATQVPVHGIILTDSPNGNLAMRRRQLRQAPRGIPIITCAIPTSRDVGKRLGVANYLVKPISRDRLLEVLSQLDKRIRTILVVDDDQEMVRLLDRMIRSSSPRYRVLRAYGGTEGLALLHAKRPDAVILDLLMPEPDGYAVLREMQAHEALRDIPVVALTARSRESELAMEGTVEITREGGLTTGELMRCVQGALDSLTLQPSSAAALREAPAS